MLYFIYQVERKENKMNNLKEITEEMTAEELAEFAEHWLESHRED